MVTLLIIAGIVAVACIYSIVKSKSESPLDAPQVAEAHPANADQSPNTPDAKP